MSHKAAAKFSTKISGDVRIKLGADALIIGNADADHLSEADFIFA